MRRWCWECRAWRPLHNEHDDYRILWIIAIGVGLFVAQFVAIWFAAARPGCA